MNLFVLYLIVFLIPIGLVSAYILLKKFNKLSDKASQIIFYVISGLSMAIAFLASFTITGKMIPNYGEGCTSLVGIPYGNNKGLNFLAWFIVSLVLPSIYTTGLSVFYKNKYTQIFHHTRFIHCSGIVLHLRESDEQYLRFKLPKHLNRFRDIFWFKCLRFNVC